MLQEQYPDLNDMFMGESLLAPAFAQDRFEGAQRSQQLNQAGALQDLYQNEQMNPLKVRKQQLDNDTSLAQLPGWQADSSLKQDKASLSRNTLGLQLSAQQRKLLADASDDDVKLLENAAQQLAYSKNPEEVAQGKKLLALHRTVLQEKEKQKYMSDRQIELEKLRGKNAMDLAKENNAAGRYKKGGGSLAIEEQLKSGKLSYEKAAVLLNNSAYMAEMEGDEDKANQYRSMANQYAQKATELRAAGGMNPAAGGADLGQMNIPTVPARPPQQLTSPTQPASAPAPQVPQGRVRVISPDGKVGSIPAAQLKDALAKGFKETK